MFFWVYVLCVQNCSESVSIWKGDTTNEQLLSLIFSIAVLLSLLLWIGESSSNGLIL